jgi:hypothetical protein
LFSEGLCFFDLGVPLAQEVRKSSSRKSSSRKSSSRKSSSRKSSSRKSSSRKSSSRKSSSLAGARLCLVSIIISSLTTRPDEPLYITISCISSRAALSLSVTMQLGSNRNYCLQSKTALFLHTGSQTPREQSLRSKTALFLHTGSQTPREQSLRSKTALFLHTGSQTPREQTCIRCTNRNR